LLHYDIFDVYYLIIQAVQVCVDRENFRAIMQVFPLAKTPPLDRYETIERPFSCGVFTDLLKFSQPC